MRHILEIQKRLVPDLNEQLQRRYSILQQIRSSVAIGRRTLAGSLGMTERVLRAETDFLKEQGLLLIDSSGMRLTDEGLRIIDQLEPIVKELFGLSDLEERLRERYGLRQVMVVAGDCDQAQLARIELGRAAASALRKYAVPDAIIAVTGGTTMAHVAEQLVAAPQLKGGLFVPARGGLGERVELQANTIASAMAKRTGGQYRMLHVPDHLSEDAYQSLMQEPNIRQIAEMIRKARIVLHGIGEALVMARRRQVPEATCEALRAEGAHAEAFGYYFDQRGEVVHKMPTIGLRLEDIDAMDTVIGVAGGASKGPAIDAILRSGHSHVLVTDEAAAKAILQEV